LSRLNPLSYAKALDPVMEALRTLVNAIVTLAVGCVIGYTAKTFHGAGPTEVRQALYVACARGSNFDPTEKLAGAYCNRLTIDSTLANAYGRGAAIPKSDPGEIAEYESPLLDVRQAP
jgi:hypothetical protein